MQALGVPKGWVALLGISAALSLIASLFAVFFLGGSLWKSGRGKIRLEDRDEGVVGEVDA